MSKKIVYTEKLGSAVAKGARSAIVGKFHVVSSNPGRWAVVSEGSTRAMRAFPTQRAAVTFAKRHVISRTTGEVVIHAKDGRIRDRISF